MSDEKLYQYQLEGASFLSKRKFALLADEMGLGKTIQAIRAMDMVGATKVLVVCPTIAKYNWAEEFNNWQMVDRSVNQLDCLMDIPSEHDVQICSFNYVSENYTILNKVKWDVVIIDEAHFCKGFNSKRTKAILGKKGIIRHTKRGWLLTGTPMPNDPSELWIMLYTFGYTPMQYLEFTKRYCITRPTSYGLKIEGARKENTAELRSLLRQFMLRRRKVDVEIQLPPISYTKILIDPCPVDLELHMGFADYFYPEDRLDDLKKTIHKESDLLHNMVRNLKGYGDKPLGAVTAVESSVSTVMRYIGLRKIDGCVEYVKNKFEYNNCKKMVIFARHRDVIETLRKRLAKFKPVTLYGGTNPKTRVKNIKRFQDNPKCQIFIGNILAAGTAINLTVAHDVLFVEQDWVPGNNAQAVMRCHRIGQNEKVIVTFAALANSIDARLMNIIRRKTMDITEIVDTF